MIVLLLEDELKIGLIPNDCWEQLKELKKIFFCVKAFIKT